MPRKLHIGGAVKADGWEVLNIMPGDHVDHVGNANDLSRFSAGTFSEIYASHILEHFDYNSELLASLKEWHRVLEPGGTLYVSVPDLDVLARLFLDKERLTGEERFFVMCMMFGGHTHKYDYHITGLNEDFLVSFLSQAGFGQYKRVDEFNIFQDSSCLRFKEELISLNIIAIRNPT